MSFEFQEARPLLKKGDLTTLFVELLGWEPSHQKLDLRNDGVSYHFQAVAEKKGFTVWQCISADGHLPDHATRLKLDRALTQTSFEHLIVFAPADFNKQSWMWVRREPGRPLSAKTHDFHHDQPGDSLLQKLQHLYVSLEEEEQGDLSTVEVARRARGAFNLEQVTGTFYNDFDAHRKAFLKFITGITEIADREWYASVMLNRLMFVYFIQRKGFLDGDEKYLRNRLERCQSENGKDKFYSFYRYFLLRLFHEGFGKRRKDRAPELEKLLGNIPYLNGGLFDVHELEKPDRYGDHIQIPDKAFERVFDFFDGWQWHLDERPLHSDNEINPDVLGYIFEKYINQKQMGAYYTKEDITEYISKSAVLPFLFDSVKTKCAIAFANPNSPTIWELLKENPDRYIYLAVRHGISWSYNPELSAKGEPLVKTRDLPKEVVAGIDVSQPKLISRRAPWNKQAVSDYALPTETWREVVARRQHYEVTKQILLDGKVCDANQFVTLNLDLRQFAQDVILGCEGPDLLTAFWEAVSTITVLDPTGGSGAFIFAALNILEPLYEACLDRMEGFLDEWGEAGEKAHPNYARKFGAILGKVEDHPNRRYFVLKSIILNNLYAVDIMEEAVEICKLRLFLKLAAQVEPDPTRDNLGIEPLPDIDFNIRAGNSLVGYATTEEVSRCMVEMGGGQMKLMDEGDLGSFSSFKNRCAEIAKAFANFRLSQTEGEGAASSSDKKALQKQLRILEEELNNHLTSDNNVKASDRSAYADWIKVHQPFHWFVQFYEIMSRGGFDVIVGNPPYVVNSAERVSYTISKTIFSTYPSKNLYAFVFERSIQLAQRHGVVGMIVQLTALSAEKMQSLQDLLLRRGMLVVSSFPRRPESIFDGVEMPVTIMLSQASEPVLHTSRVNRFYTEERPTALMEMQFVQHDFRLHAHRLAKIGTPIEVSIYKKLSAQKVNLGSLTTKNSKHVVYYQEACRYWVKACIGVPFFKRNGERMRPAHGRTLFFHNAASAAFAGCLLNSSLFYWFYSAFSDCEHINDELIRDFRITENTDSALWLRMEKRLAESQKNHAKRKTINTKQGHTIEYDEMDAPQSKGIFDEIDTLLASSYGFSQEEQDFVLNYDIKYRLGRENKPEDD
jgi:hypothetical protein